MGLLKHLAQFECETVGTDAGLARCFTGGWVTGTAMTAGPARVSASNLRNISGAQTIQPNCRSKSGNNEPAATAIHARCGR